MATSRLERVRSNLEKNKVGIKDEKTRKLITKGVDAVLTSAPKFKEAVEEAIVGHRDDLLEILSLKPEFDEFRERLTTISDMNKRQLKEELNALFERDGRKIEAAFADIEAGYDKRFKAMESEFLSSVEQVRASAKRTLEIKVPKRSPVTIENPHYLTEKVAKRIAARIDTALIGPSGSGKTHTCRQIADSLGMKFYIIACSRYDMPSKWFGYEDAGGVYRETNFFQWYTTGGLIVMDEYDNINDSIGVSLNAALDNHIMEFPGARQVERHKNAVCLASGNTIGRGVDRVFRARHGIDESTIERFDVIDWDYDYDQEMALTPNIAWTKYVQACRRSMLAHKLPYIISIRASIKGATLLAMGETVEEVERSTVFKQWPQDHREMVMRDAQHCRPV